MSDTRLFTVLFCLIVALLGCSGNKSPAGPAEHLCEGIPEHYACAKYAEDAWLALLQDKVTRLGGELVLTLRNGRTISRLDTIGEFEGDNNSAGNRNVKFTFYDYIERSGHYVVEHHYDEGGGFEFINTETGEEVMLGGSIGLSPDKTRFLVVTVNEQNGVLNQQIEAWTISRTAIQRELAYSPIGSLRITARWSNSRTIEVYEQEWADEPGKYLEKLTARFENERGMWKVSTYVQ